MIATTISNSISEKPFCFRISRFPLFHVPAKTGGRWSALHRHLTRQTVSYLRRAVVFGMLCSFNGSANFREIKAIYRECSIEDLCQSTCQFLSSRQQRQKWT